MCFLKSKRFFDIFKKVEYLGTDISSTVIKKAKKIYSLPKVQFMVDDIRHINRDLCCGFDLVFSSKTLYYVAPEIDIVIDNLKRYISKQGYLVFIYNMPKNAFSKQ